MEFTDIYDCIVVGVGGHGSASLAQLAKSGQKVLGLEQFKAVHKNGSSHGRTRVYRQAYFEDPRYVPLLLRALELFYELDDFYVSNIRDTPDREDGIGRTDSLIKFCGGAYIGPPDSEIVAGTLLAIKTHELPHTLLNAEQMRARFPTFHLADHEVAVYEENAGYLMAELCLEAYIAMARQYGADIHFEEPMLDWAPCVLADGVEGVEVRTAQGVYRAKKLVLSVGAWAPSIYGDAIPQVPMYIERRVLFWFQCDEDKVEDFNAMPIYLWDLHGPGNFYGFPSESSTPGKMKIAIHMRGDQPLYAVPHPAEVERSVSEEEVSKIREIIGTKFPGMNNELLRTETCMYTSTYDSHFIIDFHPKNKNVLLVSPCSGHGFKFISVIGEIVTDLITAGKTAHDISLFSLAKAEDGTLVREAKAVL